MDDYSIDSARIVRVLAQHGHTHRCVRCEARMLVKYESNLCVHCFNDLRTSLLAEEEEQTSAPVLSLGGDARPRPRRTQAHDAAAPETPQTRLTR
jgi:hypothetical protein